MADYRRKARTGANDWRWQEDAACRGLRTTVFFLPAGARGPTALHHEEEAKAV